MSAEQPSQSIEWPSVSRADSPNPEPCLKCLEIFRLYEDCEDTSKDDPVVLHVLFTHETMHELLPDTCPVCALIEIKASTYQEEFSEVSYSIMVYNDSRRVCWLCFYTLGIFRESQSLLIKSADSVNASRQRLKALPASTVTEESIEFLKRELTTCLERHDDCRTPSGAPPTRLLRIEESQEDVMHVYLEDSDMTRSYEYVTLSHCWGNVQPIYLTKKTEGTLRAGIKSQNLPKTFRDAVVICLRLGFQYIWIDSLSIFQDNLQDWATVAASMRSVYKNASLNVAASGATDSSVGLSFERNPLAFQPFCVTINSAYWVYPPDWPALAIQTGPLNKRAWVLQERILSTRIIHFTAAGPRWECMAAVASEVYSSGFIEITARSIDNSITFKSNFTRPAVFEGASNDVLRKKEYASHYDAWLGLLRDYSKCGITNSGDKLVAIQGIAQTMKETIGIESVCGMWKNVLILELLWQVQVQPRRVDPPHLLQWRAPSWSWASSDFPLVCETYPLNHLRCPEFEEIAKVTNLDVNALPSGQISDASLKLKGRTLRARIAAEIVADGSDLVATMSCENERSQISVDHSVFDRLPPLPYADALIFVALARCHCVRATVSAYCSTEGKEVAPTIAALMLRRLPTTPPTYSRVGVLLLKNKEAYEFYTRNQSAEEEELALV